MTASLQEMLELGRRGNPDPARLFSETHTGDSTALYIYGRGLAESGLEIETAADALKRAIAADPRNPLIRQALALALVRLNRSEARVEAHAIWKESRLLPHDLDMLGQAAISLELQSLDLPRNADIDNLPWPECLPEVEPVDVAGRSGESTGSGIPVIEYGEVTGGGVNPGKTPAPGKEPGAMEAGESEGLDEAAADKMSQSDESKKANIFVDWWHGRVAKSRLKTLERLIMEQKPVEALSQVNALLARGIETPDLHLAAGVAAEIAGDLTRARAHLARCGKLDAKYMHWRTFLGKIYLRMGWPELAIDLWRSLPVEGPYDHGRHYHLALGFAMLGEADRARAAMDEALRDFYYDTRHFYIEMAYTRWLRRFGLDSAGEKGRPAGETPAADPDKA